MDDGQGGQMDTSNKQHQQINKVTLQQWNPINSNAGCLALSTP